MDMEFSKNLSNKADPTTAGQKWAERWLRKASGIGKAVKDEAMKAGKEDPRKVVHSLKVGVAMTVASLVYLLEPLYEGIRQNSIWAVLTVVLVVEFRAGATLYKGFNRLLGTVLALSFAFLFDIVAHHLGHIECAISSGFAVFLIAVVHVASTFMSESVDQKQFPHIYNVFVFVVSLLGSDVFIYSFPLSMVRPFAHYSHCSRFAGSFTTYARFIPSINKHYDHGIIVFLVTFNLVMVGSYHDHNQFHIVTERIYAIAIGFGIGLIITLFILPNWSGEDLQNTIISKFEELAKLATIEPSYVIARSNGFRQTPYDVTYIWPGMTYGASLGGGELVWAVGVIWLGYGLRIKGSFPKNWNSVNLAACVDEYFQELDAKGTCKFSNGSSLDNSYEEAVQSNSTEEALATFASWEPRHSRYCYPWKQYEHLGVGLRHLGFTAVALHGCLESHIQVYADMLYRIFQIV
ncbi:unnamed protein product [Ilex paraguariensis]|uniref:Aluminum-activated malate transporter n=1 Tax=Ilex paraguariensis TaxID=185542 RepID=A0ABC8REI6_9AQUA